MSSLDYLDLCRLCLVKDRVSVSIFDGEGEDRQIYLKIAACLPVKLGREDKLPKKICDDCLYKVELLYEFWNTTSNAEKQLWQWLGEVELEDKQGYIGSNINSALMKSEQGENRLNVVQASAEHQNMGLNMIDNMGLTMPIIMSPGQAISVPISSSETVQTVQSMAGPSSQARKDREDDEDSTEDDNTEDEIDHDEGLPVKEENEDTRIIEPTNFVNVASMACDEAGPSGLQQKLPEMALQATDVDPKSGLDDIIEITDGDGANDQNDPLDLSITAHYSIQIIEKISSEVEDMSLNIKRKDQNSNDEHPATKRQRFVEVELKCVACSRYFSDEKLWQNHMAIHGTFICYICGRKKSSEYYLNIHLQHHLESRMETCALCQKKFDDKVKLTNHMLEHAPANQFNCNICQLRFWSRDYLVTHMRTHFLVPVPASSKKTYNCIICNYNTIVESKFKEHMLTHPRSDHVRCPQCGKIVQKTYMKAHSKLHSGQKPEVCDICGKSFALPQYLRRHRRLHADSAVRQCTICLKVFASRMLLAQHSEVHNPTYL